MSDTIAQWRTDVENQITNQTDEEAITPEIDGALRDRLALLVDERLLSGGDTRGATVIAGTKDNHNFGINTNNLRRLTVTAAGRVLIGTTTESTYQLDVASGGGRVQGGLYLDSPFTILKNSVYMDIGQSGGGGWYIGMRLNSVRASLIGQSGWLITDAATDRVAADRDASAVLHLNSDAKGFLMTRMPGSSFAGISSKAAGLIAYDNEAGTNRFIMYDGTRVCYIPKVLRASATLDFPSTAAGAFQDLTITVTGAAVNDAVQLGIPNASVGNGFYQAWVSATNTVTVRHYNFTGSAVDPASGTFTAIVFK